MPSHPPATNLQDPNTLSEDGTTALGAVSFSEDGEYMAYGINKAGSDWMTIQVRPWRLVPPRPASEAESN